MAGWVVLSAIDSLMMDASGDRVSDATCIYDHYGAGDSISDATVSECAELFSGHYATWSDAAKKPGKHHHGSSMPPISSLADRNVGGHDPFNMFV